MKNEDLNETRRIIEGLAARFDSLPADDQRFVLSWQQTLSNVQPDFIIGKARLAMVSRVGALYGLVPQDVAAARYATAQAGTRRLD